MIFSLLINIKMAFSHLLAEKISYSAELSTKKFITSGPDLGLCCPLTESLDNVDYISLSKYGEVFLSDCAASPVDLDFYCSHLLRKIFCHGATHYENMPIQIYRKFHLQKLKIFR